MELFVSFVAAVAASALGSGYSDMMMSKAVLQLTRQGMVARPSKHNFQPWLQPPGSKSVLYERWQHTEVTIQGHLTSKSLKTYTQYD